MRRTAASAPVRTEVTISLLRAMVTAIGAVSLFIFMHDERAPDGLILGVLILSVVAALSLLSVIPLVRLSSHPRAHRAAMALTAFDLLVCAGYSWRFADRPGAGSAYPAFVLIMGPVRWGWRGIPITGIPIGIVATLWPQQTLSGTTYNTGQIWFLVALFSVSTAAITTFTRQSSARLRQAQEQFQVAFEHASIGMALLDGLGNIVKANRSLSLLLGTDEEHLLGTRLVDHVEGEHSQRLSHTLAGLCAQRPAARLEVRARRPDQEPRWGLVAASWVEGGDSVPARVVLQVENITERKEAEVRMSYLANHDNLTGLPNRGLLRSCLAASIERGDRVGVLFLDLDRFKVVNDGLGHAAGDALLVAMATRLAAVLRPGDLAARIGGDEFVMLCNQIGHTDDLLSIGNRVLEALRPEVSLGAESVAVTVSIGAAVASTGATADSVLRDADTAMYAAKTSGGNRVQRFTPVLHQRALHSRELEVALARAVQAEELELVYQPVVDLATGQVSSLEALARWSHPTWGSVAPSEFVPIAEKSDLIVALGTWVLRRALQDAATWPTAYGSAAGVAVNVSPRQLSHGDFPALVRTLLAEVGLPGDRLCIEITETALIGDIGPVVAVLRSLRELGVRLAIDDFGTGHASLSYLTQFPVDTVKIDRSFVSGVATDAGSSAIVGGVVAMAHAYGLRVVAEGAETAEQLGQLRRLGCEFAQGFVLSHPLAPSAVASALRAAARIDSLVPAPRRGDEPDPGLDEARRYRLLLESAREISACLDLESVLERSFAALRKVISFTGGSIQLVDGDVIRLAVTDPPATTEAMTASVPLGQGVGGMIAATGVPRYLPDITIVAALSSPAPRKVTSFGVRSYYGVPLMAEGRVIGVLQIDSTEIDAFTERDQLLVLSFASVVAAAVQTARMFAVELTSLQAPPAS